MCENVLTMWSNNLSPRVRMSGLALSKEACGMSFQSWIRASAVILLWRCWMQECSTWCPDRTRSPLQECPDTGCEDLYPVHARTQGTQGSENPCLVNHFTWTKRLRKKNPKTSCGFILKGLIFTQGICNVDWRSVCVYMPVKLITRATEVLTLRTKPACVLRPGGWTEEAKTPFLT